MFLYLWSIVQIITESLPISSSGHVELLQRIMSTYNLIDFENCHNLWAFDYVLQGVSACIFLIYFFSSWWQLVIQKPVKISSLLDCDVWMRNILPVFIFGVVADGMTFLLWLGFALSLWFAESFTMLTMQLPLTIGFMITGCALWSLRYAREKKDMYIWSWKSAMLVGFVQGCALLPGISRFAATVVTLQWLGYSGRLAFSISFLLQWPLIVAGSLLGLFNLRHSLILQSIVTWPLLLTVFGAAYVGYLVFCIVGRMVDKNMLWKFSYYMMIPTIISLVV